MTMSVLLLILIVGVLECNALGCTYNGADHQIGDKFKSTDGCNECVCGAIGVVCTKMLCLPKATTTQPLKSCTVTAGGVTTTYADGQSFKSADGCNTCSCSNGIPMCTLMACMTSGTCTDPATGKVHNNGDTFPSSDGCNTCNCFNSVISCTEKYCLPSSYCYDRVTGNIYNSGDSFNAPDGCNSCSCKDGTITCTKNSCISV